ncbi:C2 domain-containing At1g53590-like protein [Labeo rohita]|uniref:C2 domain-containing At1g53590-like protein n=1 Tax=Labeo rohita TaxID=84645 RepID=A0A498L6P8_LABRO|nr:C2 domain-containing At1g53590-like protein [Labeo rohita]RXN33962.1 C2 domain-containing At1g53590-like protein [Labeo rohita]
MAIFYHLRLMSLAVLMLVSQLNFANAAVRVYSVQASNLAANNMFGSKPDPYVKIWCGSSYGGMTDFQQSTRNPVWVAEFNFPNCKVNDNLKLEVWDKDRSSSDDLLGTCTTYVQRGNNAVPCSLKKGTLYYSYTN